jgi:hypothetical protein
VPLGQLLFCFFFTFCFAFLQSRTTLSPPAVPASSNPYDTRTRLRCLDTVICGCSGSRAVR